MSPNPRPPDLTQLGPGIAALFERLPLPHGFAGRAALLFAVLLFLLIVLPGSKPDGGVTEAGTEAVPPSAGVIRLSVRAAGLLRAEGQRPLFAQVAGTLAEVPATGDGQVSAGQVLARIEDEEYRNALDDATSRMTAAHAKAAGLGARLAQSRRELRRSERLYAAKLIPRNELEEAQVALQELEARQAAEQAQVIQSATALARALRNLELCELRSPIEGVLLNTRARTGMPVRPGEEIPLFSVAPNLDRMEIRVSVTEADVGKVAAGQKTTFQVQAYPGRDFTGEVREIHRGGARRDGVTYFDVTVAADNPGQLLLPGMSAEVVIDAGEREVARQVPLRALLYNPPADTLEHWQDEIDRIRQRGFTPVWTLDDEGEVRPVGVELGIQDRERLELTGDWPYGDARVLYQP